MYCYHCGEKLAEEALYCHSCGAKVVEMTDQKQDQHPQQTQQIEQPQETIVYQEPINRKKGTAFVVIGWVCFGLSIAFCLSPAYIPITFGLIALILGILVINVRSKTHGIILTTLSIVGALLSILTGYVVNMILHNYYYL